MLPAVYMGQAHPGCSLLWTSPPHNEDRCLPSLGMFEYLSILTVTYKPKHSYLASAS